MADKPVLSREPLQQQASRERKSLPRQPPITPRSVLILEDHDLEREGLAAVLRPPRYGAVAAPGVDSAPGCESPSCLFLLDCS